MLRKLIVQRPFLDSRSNDPNVTQEGMKHVQENQ